MMKNIIYFSRKWVERAGGKSRNRVVRKSGSLNVNNT